MADRDESYAPHADGCRCILCERQSIDWERAEPAIAAADKREGLAHRINGRSGGMNDPRHIHCDGCGEVAVTFTGNAESLTPGELFGECTCWGRLNIEKTDEGGIDARFIRIDCD